MDGWSNKPRHRKWGYCTQPFEEVRSEYLMLGWQFLLLL